MTFDELSEKVTPIARRALEVEAPDIVRASPRFSRVFVRSALSIVLSEVVFAVIVRVVLAVAMRLALPAIRKFIDSLISVVPEGRVDASLLAQFQSSVPPIVGVEIAISEDSRSKK